MKITYNASFNTTKTSQGFAWTVTQYFWSDEAQKCITVFTKTGIEANRAKATKIAKKWVLFLRNNKNKVYA